MASTSMTVIMIETIMIDVVTIMIGTEIYLAGTIRMGMRSHRRTRVRMSMTQAMTMYRRCYVAVIMMRIYLVIFVMTCGRWNIVIILTVVASNVAIIFYLKGSREL